MHRGDITTRATIMCRWNFQDSFTASCAVGISRTVSQLHVPVEFLEQFHSFTYHIETFDRPPYGSLKYKYEQCSIQPVVKHKQNIGSGLWLYLQNVSYSADGKELMRDNILLILIRCGKVLTCFASYTDKDKFSLQV